MDSETLKKAIDLSKQGKKQEARSVLQGLVQHEPENSQAWLWLADAMSTPPERLKILQEALRHNPDNAMIRRAVDALGGSKVPAPAPKPAAPGPALHFSTAELKSLERRISPEAAEDTPPQEQPETKPQANWLQPLRSTNPQPPTAAPRPKPLPVFQPVFKTPEPEITPEEEKPAEKDEVRPREVADWLASLEQEQPAPKAAAKPAFDWTEPLQKEPEPKSTPFTRPVEEDDAEEPAPRRRWLVVVLVVILAAVLVAAAVLVWPMIQPTVMNTVTNATNLIFPPPPPTPTDLPAGYIPPTLTPSATPTFTPTPKPSATLTPTRTFTPTATPTITPVPLLLSAGLPGTDNIQQFKSLAYVKAKGAVSLEARQLAAVTDSNSLKIWDFLSGNAISDLTGPKAPIKGAAVSADGKLAAAASLEPAVWVWDIQKQVVLATLRFSPDFEALFTAEDFPRGLQVQFSPDGKSVFATSLLGVTWWDIQTRQEHHVFPLLPLEYKTFRDQAAHPVGRNATTFLLSFRPDGKAFAIGSPNKVYILSWPGAGGLATLVSNKPLVDMRWMENGLLGLYQQGQVSVWNTILNKQLLTFPALKSASQDLPPSAAFLSNGTEMAVEVENDRGVPGGLQLIALPGGTKIKMLDPQTNEPVEQPIFSPDGKLIFGASGGDLFIWDSATGKILRRIANRKGFSELSADGKYYLEVSATDTSIWGIAQ
jgi:WD40 repeat protein